MDGVQFKVDGLDALVAKLDGLSYDLKRKGGRLALRKAAQVVRDEARANALRVDDPKTSEVIAKNIVERWNGRVFRRQGDLAFRVGVLGGARAVLTDRARRKSARRRERLGQSSLGSLGEIAGSGKANPGGDTWYWRFLEFGTERTRAQPFLRPALEQNISAAMDTFVREYDKALDRAIKKAVKKGTKA